MITSGYSYQIKALSLGKWTPHTSGMRPASIREQSAATIRRNSGIGRVGPCATIRRSVRSHPRRSHRLQATSNVRRRSAIWPRVTTPDESCLRRLIPCGAWPPKSRLWGPQCFRADPEPPGIGVGAGAGAVFGGSPVHRRGGGGAGCSPPMPRCRNPMPPYAIFRIGRNDRLELTEKHTKNLCPLCTPMVSYPYT